MVYVDRLLVAVMGGRAVGTATFRPLDQGVPGTEVKLLAGTAGVVAEAVVHSMGCGWESDYPGPW